MPATISISTSSTDRATVVVVGGEVDLATAPQLDGSIDLDTTTPIIVLDLSAVTFMDSTGLRSIIQAHDAAAQKGKQLRVVPGDKAAGLLQMTGLTARLHVFATREEALQDG
jgi:anti-anti-sigma factor